MIDHAAFHPRRSPAVATLRYPSPSGFYGRAFFVDDDDDVRARCQGLLNRLLERGFDRARGELRAAGAHVADMFGLGGRSSARAGRGWGAGGGVAGRGARVWIVRGWGWRLEESWRLGGRRR